MSNTYANILMTQKQIMLNTENYLSENDIGNNILFKNKWKIYVHKTESNDWSYDSFDKDFFTIDSISSFLQFHSNFHKLDSRNYTFFIMKSQDDDFIHPTWEHEKNRNGGTCSLRVEQQHGCEIMQQLCFLLVNGSLTNNSEIINGISYVTKTNWAVIKIWTSTTDNITSSLPSSLFNSYSNLNIRFKPNEPEY